MADDVFNLKHQLNSVLFYDLSKLCLDPLLASTGKGTSRKRILGHGASSVTSRGPRTAL